MKRLLENRCSAEKMSGTLWFLLLSLFFLVYPPLSLSQEKEDIITFRVTGYEEDENSLPKLNIVYPREGHRMRTLKKSFVFGSVEPPNAVLWINASTVSVYKTGSFLANIPFDYGEFKIRALANYQGNSFGVVRTVHVSSPSLPLPEKPITLVKDKIQPNLNMRVTPGDRILIRVKGTPGGHAEYRFKKLVNRRLDHKWQKMVEKGRSGIYESSYVIDPNDRAEEAYVQYRLKGKDGGSAKLLGEAKIKVLDTRDIQAAKVTSNLTVLKAGPSAGSESMGYDMFLPQGTKVKVYGGIGRESRVMLSDNVYGWTDTKNLASLPEGSPLPLSVLTGLTADNTSRSVILKFRINDKVPFRAVLSEDLRNITLYFHYTISNFDSIQYDSLSGKKWIEQVNWKQSDSETVEVNSRLKRKIWGYDIEYENNILKCTILFMPKLKKIKGKPLTGLKVAIDPGHSPRIGDGAVSPKGVPEGEVAYKISTCFKQKLENYGAKVYLTRKLDETISLDERGKRAWANNADLFISIHANAVPDGADPYTKSGFSVFYFQPQSLKLARYVHASYRKRTGLVDDGLFYKNLAVCRITQMPSILTESGYLIRPDEERLLLDRKFQCRIGELTARGIIDFVRNFEK